MSAEMDNNQGLLNAALEISARRAQTLREIRDLFVEGKDSEAMKLTKRFLGVEEKKPRLALVKGSRD